MDSESNERENKDLNFHLNLVDEHHQQTISNINNRLKSRWIGKDERLTLQMTRALLQLTADNTKQNLKQLFFMDNLQRRIVTLEQIVQNLSMKTDVDLTDIKSQLKKLNKTVKKPVYSFIDEYLKEQIELKKKLDKWRGDNR